jgi:DNA-binding NtrC family response regulator
MMQTYLIQNQEEPPTSPTRVLVVEDEFLIRISVSDHLRETGFAVVEASNGDEAISVLKAGVAFDVVFTDVRMPGATDGLGLLAYVRATQPGLPVVVTSGHLAPGLAIAGGAVEFLAKPCGLERLAHALRPASSCN